MLKSTPQEGAADTHFATELRITIASAAGVDVVTGVHRFRIVNLDGQFADISFTADPPVISKVFEDGKTLPDAKAHAITTNTAAVKVVIEGQGLRQGSTVTWQKERSPDAEPAALTPDSPTDGKTLKVSLVPGPSGQGRLTVITPSGFVGTATVEVLAAGGGPTAPPPATAQSATTNPQGGTGTVPPTVTAEGAPTPGPSGEGGKGAAAPNPGPAGTPNSGAPEPPAPPDQKSG